MSNTTFLRAQNYSNDIPLNLAPAAEEPFGTRYALTTADDKQLVIVFPNCTVKPCINSQNRPFLALDNPSKDTQIVTVLGQLRARVADLLKIEESEMKSILSRGKGLLDKRESLLLNLLKKTSFKDLNKVDVDYSALVGKHCQIGLFVHIQSVFKGDAGFSLQVKVSQMVLQAAPEESLSLRVEAIDPTTVEDPAELL